MSKKTSESFLEYQQRVLDSKSKSFCGAKWFNATIWLGSGKTTSCHHPPAQQINSDELKKNPTALHNTLHKKEMRRLMQKGERPAECEYCWKIEDMNKQATSDRVFKSVIYSEADLDFISRLDPMADVNLQTLEIAFDRTCQFACSYCNANFSTTWGKDIKDHGKYRNLISDGAGHFTTDGSESDFTSDLKDNPYVEAFWRWWPELSQTLKELRITGGEPLMTPHLWKLFDYFGDRGGSGELVFAVNSNLGAKPELIERLIEKSHYINRFKLFTSGEAFGLQAEYIRDGLNYKTWFDNLEKVLMYGRLESTNLMLTINALSLFSMIDFLNHTLQLKQKYSVGYLTWSVNILRFPSFQNALVLPLNIRQRLAENLKDWCDNHFHLQHITDFEKDSLQRLVHYLVSVEEPHAISSSKSFLENDFKQFYQQYDIRRRKNFKDTFPSELVEWMESLSDRRTEASP